MGQKHARGGACFFLWNMTLGGVTKLRPNLPDYGPYD